MTQIKFCTACGSPTKESIPVDDDHLRAVCTNCGQIHYLNPKMVVGCIPLVGEKILMCQRNIEPQKGLWTLPAGFLENSETVQDGAVRETLEETRAAVDHLVPYRLINIPVVSQIYFMFIADVVSKDFGPTMESMAVRLFDEKQIPWEEIAFKSIDLTLRDFIKDRRKGKFPFKILDIT